MKEVRQRQLSQQLQTAQNDVVGTDAELVSLEAQRKAAEDEEAAAEREMAKLLKKME